MHFLILSNNKKKEIMKMIINKKNDHANLDWTYLKKEVTKIKKKY
jgi:hypothetical protein